MQAYKGPKRKGRWVAEEIACDVVKEVVHAPIPIKITTLSEEWDLAHFLLYRSGHALLWDKKELEKGRGH